MQAQDFDIGQEQPGPLDRAGQFGQGRNIAAGENVFCNPRVGGAGPVSPANGVNERNAIVLEHIAKLAEIFFEVIGADVFEHADGHDPVETFLDQTVILQAEVDPIAQVLCHRAPVGDGQLFRRQGHPCHVRAGDFSQIQPHAAPAAADVENGMSCPGAKLGDDMAFLGQLGFLQTGVRMLIIGAGILHIGIKKQGIQPAIEIVVMGDIGARIALGVVLFPAADQVAHVFGKPQHAAHVSVQDVALSGHIQVEYVAALDLHLAVHVDFAESQRRITDQPRLGGCVGEDDFQRLADAIAD